MTTQNKKKWTTKEIEEFKSLILEKRNKVIDDLAESRKRADEARENNSVNAIYSSHMADASTDQEEMEKSYYWMGRDNKFLQYLNRSLEMIKGGTFGICTTCDELISKERLEEVPHTSKCFNCKSQEA